MLSAPGTPPRENFTRESPEMRCGFSICSLAGSCWSMFMPRASVSQRSNSPGFFARISSNRSSVRTSLFSTRSSPGTVARTVSNNADMVGNGSCEKLGALVQAIFCFHSTRD